MFRSHFRWLICLIIWFLPLILLLCVFLLVLNVFANFNFASSKHVIRRCLWGPNESKKIAKETLNDLTRAYCGKYHSPGRSNKKQKFKKKGSNTASHHHGLPVVAATAHGGCPWLPPFLRLLAFFAAVRILMRFYHEFVHKASFCCFFI